MKGIPAKLKVTVHKMKFLILHFFDDFILLLEEQVNAGHANGKNDSPFMLLLYVYGFAFFASDLVFSVLFLKDTMLTFP